MRQIPAVLRDALDSGVTTHCHCWKLTRRDGVAQGFTDHDCDLVFGGVTYRAGTGFVASEAVSRFDLSSAGSDVSGVLADTSLNDIEMAAGIYDAADIETWLVDWSEPEARMLTFKGTIGEIRREGQAFVAELRGLADRLSQESGRLYTSSCSADLGDARCRADLTSPARRATGSVVAMLGVSTFVAEGLDAFETGFFTAGRLTWVSGANSGRSIEIKEHRLEGGGVVRLKLWQAMASSCEAGDAFEVTAGCDKRFSTCRDRFGNGVNFRGFPHIPGNDFIVNYPVPGEPGHSGQSIVKG